MQEKKKWLFFSEIYWTAYPYKLEAWRESCSWCWSEQLKEGIQLALAQRSKRFPFILYFLFTFFTFVPFFALSSHLFFGSGQWERPFLTRNGKTLTLRPCQEQELGLSPSSKLRQTRDYKCSCFRPSKHWSQFRMPSDPWTSTCWWVYDSFCICEWVYESFLYLRELKGLVATARFKRMSQ